MIVADTNVLVHYFVQGPKTTLAQQVFTRDPDWIVPPLWRHEFLNVLVTFVRNSVMSLDSARSAWHQADQALEPCEIEPCLDDTVSLAIETGLAAYDAEFIVLARSQSVSCVTEDVRLLEKCPDLAISMEAFLDRTKTVREPSPRYRAKRTPKRARPLQR